jgi:hypothetical protein
MITPKILTQKIDRPNKNYPNGYIGPKHFFKRYPYKTTVSGSRSNIVAVDELSDHPYRLTQGQFSKIIQTYFKYLAEYLITGKVYEFPVARLGSIKLVKLKWTPKINFPLYNKEGIKAPVKNDYMNGYIYQILWYKKPFQFKDLWTMKLSAKIMRKLYTMTMKNPSLFYNIDSKYGV